MAGACARIIVVLTLAAAPVSAQQPQPDPDRNFVETIVDDVRSVASFALKHAIRRGRPDGEARSFPSGHAAGTFAAGAALGVLSGRAATFELGPRRLSVSPSVSADGALLIGGSIQ